MFLKLYKVASSSLSLYFEVSYVSKLILHTFSFHWPSHFHVTTSTHQSTTLLIIWQHLLLRYSRNYAKAIHDLHSLTATIPLRATSLPNHRPWLQVVYFKFKIYRLTFKIIKGTITLYLRPQDIQDNLLIIHVPW